MARSSAVRKAPEKLTGYHVEHTRESKRAILREMILEDGRIDILARYVLKFPFDMQPFHRSMLDWQSAHQEGMILAWRGAAKTSFLTVARCIYEILLNPNIRILLVSDAEGQAKTFLRQIKSHLRSNQTLIDVFGDYYTGSPAWSETEIIVNRRTQHYGEPTIMCAGIGTTLPSRHFDIIIADDLVTEENSATEGQRAKTHNYFYKTLLPTLLSPFGRLWVIGTRWHEEDLYGWLQKEDYREAVLVIGVLDEETDQSRWEESFPTERMHRIRKGNISAFELQYQCSGGTAGGGIFSIEHFMWYDHLPDNVFKWQGVDLAVGQKSVNDFFAHVTIGIHKESKDPYLISARKLRLTFPRQAPYIARQYDRHPETLRVVCETNAYQLALKQTLAQDYPDIPCLGRYTLKDKIARAQQVAKILTDHPLRVKRQHHDFVRHMIGFPNKKGSKDLFDAFELALGQGMRGARKKRENEPGLL